MIVVKLAICFLALGVVGCLVVIASQDTMQRDVTQGVENWIEQVRVRCVADGVLFRRPRYSLEGYRTKYENGCSVRIGNRNCFYLFWVAEKQLIFANESNSFTIDLSQIEKYKVEKWVESKTTISDEAMSKSMADTQPRMVEHYTCNLYYMDAEERHQKLVSTHAGEREQYALLQFLETYLKDKEEKAEESQ